MSAFDKSIARITSLTVFTMRYKCSVELSTRKITKNLILTIYERKLSAGLVLNWMYTWLKFNPLF